MGQDRLPEDERSDHHDVKKGVKQQQQISFTVQSIDCITCWPVFRRHLGKVNGVLEVKELPITNKIIVVFDGSKVDRPAVLREINDVAKRAGYDGKVIFSR